MGDLSLRTVRLITADAEEPRRPAEYHRSSRPCRPTTQEVQEVHK